jgi:transcriptional regulator with XRE-family HTH domain
MRRGLTQAELARAARVSVSMISKAEQGEYTPRLPALRKIAEALRVPSTSLSTAPDAAPPDDGEVAAWEPVRRAIETGPEGAPDAEPSAAAVEEECAHAVRLVLASRFTEVRDLLPPLLRDAGVLAVAGEKDAPVLQSRVRQLTGYMLGQTWQLDAAARVLALALDAGGDPGSERAAAAWLAWARLRGGDLDGCASLASDWADRTPLVMGRATLDEIAAWGRFQVLVATVAARDNRPSEAASALRWARSAAVGAGKDYIPSANPWDVFGPRTVEMAAGEIAVVQGNPGKALTIAGRLDGKGFPVPRNWMRHRLDVAAAHAAQPRGDGDQDAVAVLTGVLETAPEWLAQQRGAHATVGAVLDRARRKRVIPDDVRTLADAMRVPV